MDGIPASVLQGDISEEAFHVARTSVEALLSGLVEASLVSACNDQFHVFFTEEERDDSSQPAAGPCYYRHRPFFMVSGVH